MKRLLTLAAITLGATVLLGLAACTARASEPAAAPLPLGSGAPVVTAPGTPVMSAPGAPVVTPAPIIVHAPDACAPACDTTCLKKICVPGTDVKVTTKRVYGDVCEDFCMPKCGLPKLSLHHNDCDTCPTEGCPSCEHHIYTKKFLVVHVKKCEEVVNKCHVELQPEEPTCRRPLFGHKHAEPAACLPETVIIQSPPPVIVTPGSKMPQATDNTKPK